MSHQIIWDPVARNELREIYYFIKEDSPNAASRVRNSIIEGIEKIAKLPLHHGIDPHLGAPYRRKLIGTYQVIYRLDQDGLLYIVQIIDSRRSPKKKERR